MEVRICGRAFEVSRAYTSNRNASAKLRDGVIRISLPSRWPKGEKERVADNLLRRAVKAIESGRWRETSGKVAFSHGSVVSAMGRRFGIEIVHSARFSGRSDGRTIRITADMSRPEAGMRIAAIARKRIVEEVMPALEERVRSLNETHFGARISSLSVRDTSSRWGSCSRDGDISLSFRLLFMPQEILDYVIIHELAHTRYRSHGKRFWELVGRAVPDHKERRRWLRENGMDYPKAEAADRGGGEDGACAGDGGRNPKAGSDAQMTITEWIEEPY